MTNRWATVVRGGLVLAGLGTLTGESAHAQEVRDRPTLQAESARAVRLRSEGKYRDALPIAQRVAAAAEKLFGPDSVETAFYLNRLGLLHGDLGQYAQAEPVYRRCLQIREDKLGKDHPLVATSLNNLAFVYSNLGEYAKAEPLFRRGLQIQERQLGANHLEVATTLNNLAAMYNEQGEEVKAEPLYQRSLGILQANLGKDHPQVADSLNNLALVYQHLGQYAKAEPLFQRSLAIGESKLGKNHPQVAITLGNLATLYWELEQPKKAEPLLLRSLQISEDNLGKGNPRIAAILHNLAAIYQDLGEYVRAEQLLQRSLEITENQLGKDHPDTARCLNNLAYLYKTLGEYAKAEPLFRRTLQIQEVRLGPTHPEVATTLSSLASLSEAAGQTARAAELTDRARRIARRYVTGVLPALSEAEQTKFLRRRGVGDRGDWTKALSLGLRHPDQKEVAELSAGWLVNGKGITQEAMAQAALLALDTRDQRLSKVVQELLQTRQQLARLTLTPPDSAKVEERQRNLDKLNQREQELAIQLRLAGGRAGDTSWVELPRLRQALPRDAVLINLARFEVFDFQATGGQKQRRPARYAAWVIPAEGPVRVLDLGPADAIDADVRKARQALQDAPKAIRLKGEADAEKAVLEPLEALARKVLQPLLPHIDKTKQWVVSPDGNLWLVPWAALPLTDGRYAVEGHTLSYVISGRDLVQSLPAKAAPAAPLVLADPDFDLDPAELSLVNRRVLREQEAPAETRGLSQALRLGRIQRLPGTAAEAQAIKDKLRDYAGVAPRVLTDKDATVSLFQAVRNPRVVVLSTHGYFLPDQEAEPDERDHPGRPNAAPQGLRLENPLLRCGLLLAGCNNAARAPANGDNGVLTGLQIVGTDLRGCALVVLSACETGLGEVRNGEGVAGLRQAFQLAGAQSVVATLWQVPDQQSAQLMIGFFNNLADKQDKAEALRNAQLALIKTRRDKTAAAHPYFWAAFTVTGR
jgi:CHAT domain-containing protein/Tfp pilus assembly protein PilF